MPAEQMPEEEAGFTLIELMISLGLFALIAVAGLALVDGIIKVQGRTEGRLDRLADLQRAMFVVTSDIDQLAAGNISGGGTSLSFTRAAPGMGGPAIPLRYAVAGGSLVRGLGPVPQRVLGGIAAARWRFWDGAWVDHWPMSEQGKTQWPRAIALEMQLVGPGGTPASVRRVIALPARAAEAPQP
ncbi:type II secretion system protein J [Sphingomonas sp. S2-65]|uniref:PulJ/GspJ family protein n=1 Tax=Sphingomonas sp. S2-65 TaxID=2903960 RepID=UPI001F41C66C|nr:prepilin-type N-terminal cleavage/methylation domain-containing protein [Sphingomonas sp. S2-65]UYY59632.1 prepilin-type N-terminal cleavage/methylation domain-containing protein [Sphingomonas sp. S2-65]